MKTHIALLRGINVSGQKKIKMAELSRSLEKHGFQQVKTYIQSGNIVFQSKSDNAEELQNRMHHAILADFGFDVPVLILTVEKLIRILKLNPYANEPDTKGLYYVLLKTLPSQDLIGEFNKLEFENEDFSITKECVYLFCRAGFGKAKLDNNFVERRLKVQATTRNLRTLNKLVEMTKG
ncbi:DUF1697 domain-containing protein [Flagellimonas sp.]|uniref:DUF1697 domain-containing protein n=1 Tax=Flagellimonas sp. TaxID=2058762 RepID=UPI003B58EA7D